MIFVLAGSIERKMLDGSDTRCNDNVNDNANNFELR